MKIYILVALFLVDFGESEHYFPKYLKVCKRNDPKLNQCFKKRANEIIPILSNGEKNLNVSSLDPFHLSSAKLLSSKNLRLDVTNITVYGISDIRVTRAKVDFANNKCDVYLRSKALALLADYKIDGQLLILPITGQGRLNVTIEDNALFSYNFQVEMIKKEGEEWIKILDSKLSFEVNEAPIHFDLTNLFNGNKQLAEPMLKFLNDNSHAVLDELGSPIVTVIKGIVDSLLTNFFAEISYDKIFPVK